MSFISRLSTHATQSLKIAPIVAGTGALFGFCYGKLAAVPAGQASKVWAIYLTALNTILLLSSSLTKDPMRQMYIKSFVSITITGLGIYELRKRALLGDKLMMMMIAVQLIATLGLVLLATNPIKADGTNSRLH